MNVYLSLSDYQIEALDEYFLDLAKVATATAVIQQVFLYDQDFVVKMFRIILGVTASLLLLLITLLLRKDHDYD